MLVCYGLIIHRLSTTKVRSANNVNYKKSVRNAARQKKKSLSRSDKIRKHVTIMCAALVTCFLVLWLPFHAIHLAKLKGINFKVKNFSLNANHFQKKIDYTKIVLVRKMIRDNFVAKY